MVEECRLFCSVPIPFVNVGFKGLGHSLIEGVASKVLFVF